VGVADHHFFDVTLAIDQDADHPIEILGQERQLGGKLLGARLGRRNPSAIQLFELFFLAGLQAVQVPVNITSSDR
jgi:hypothetical protein